MTEAQIVNRNATPVAFGWQFQINAAIVLFIRNIKDASSIRVEGNYDDIEITLADGSVIYGQAKARAGSNPGEGSTGRFKSSLVTLADDLKQENCGKILYITNDEHPFGKTNSSAMFGDDCLYGFNELPESVQTYIKQTAYEKGITDADLEKFAVCVIGFYGDDIDTRYRVIKRYVAKLLSSLKLMPSHIVDEETLRSMWESRFLGNAATSCKDVTVEKKDFVWPIIVSLCEVADGDRYFEEFDEDEIHEVLGQYNSIINSAVERFSFTTKVVSDYEEFKTSCALKSRSLIRRAFIDERWNDYFDELGLDEADKETAEKVAKLILTKVITRSTVIKTIKNEVNL